MAFKSMMEDIKTGKDNVSFVLVFKLSRFGRNAADVLNSLQTMQDYGVNLICVEDGIDSSKEAGRLMISVLSAVAAQVKKYEKVNTTNGQKIYLLSGLLKCPVCGASMYGNKSIKSRKDGT